MAGMRRRTFSSARPSSMRSDCQLVMSGRGTIVGDAFIESLLYPPVPSVPSHQMQQMQQLLLQALWASRDRFLEH